MNMSRLSQRSGAAVIALVAASGIAWAAGGGGSTETVPSDRHFHAKGKPPSEFTKAIIRKLREELPFKDTKDFEEAKKGFIAAPPYTQIKADAGHVAWDIGRYRFLLDNKDYDSIHPSLQRQSVLNMGYGLFKVKDGIYQIRGYDLANITFIEGEKGWIVFDPLTAAETARAALDFINEKLGKRPVTAVVYSHSHADHFGGVRGVVDENDVRSGKVQIIAPIGFMEYAVSENVYAGNAMNRRMFFQYGVLLPASPFGHVDQAIGKNTAAGALGLIPPNRIISKDIEKLTVDGVEMIFQNTPGAEAPAEMNTYFPKLKALWMAENVTATVHNIYTLRGALVRDALKWSKEINRALYLFGDKSEVMFASHSWPRWGKNRVQEVLRCQRDVYANLNNQVLNLANKGVTVNEIHNVYQPPQVLQQQWCARSYHGSVPHNSRAVINRYLGYWDANPATLLPLSPKDSAPLYVDMMGGAEKIIARGKELYGAGRYKLAMEILNKLVFADPDNREAKDLLADVFEQIGYQQEGTGTRNSFLAAAYELRSGIPQGASPKSLTPDMIKAMSTELFLDFMAIRMDSNKAEGKAFKINIALPDVKEKFVLELSNATLTNIEGYQVEDPDLTITINRSDLEMLMGAQKSFDQLVAEGKAKLKGDAKVIDQLAQMLDVFTPTFEMLPGTAEKKTTLPAVPNKLAQPTIELRGE